MHRFRDSFAFQMYFFRNSFLIFKMINFIIFWKVIFHHNFFFALSSSFTQKVSTSMWRHTLARLKNNYECQWQDPPNFVSPWSSRENWSLVFYYLTVCANNCDCCVPSFKYLINSRLHFQEVLLKNFFFKFFLTIFYKLHQILIEKL